MRNPTLLFVLLSGAAATACVGERDPAFDRPRVVDGPIPLKDRVAYVDGALDRVVLVDADPEAPTVASIGVGRRPIWSAPDPQRDHLLVITRGEEALTRGQVDQDPMLWYVDVASGTTRRVPTPLGGSDPAWSPLRD